MESYDAIRRDSRRPLLRRLMLTLILLLVVGVPLLFYAVRRFERAATFYPVAFDGGPTWRLPRGAGGLLPRKRGELELRRLARRGVGRARLRRAALRLKGLRPERGRDRR